MDASTFTGRFLELAHAAPGRAAVTTSEGTYTRAALLERAAATAQLLRDHGVGSGDFVAMVLPNGVDWFSGSLAAWSLGAIPQPVSHRSPVAELALILDLTKPRVAFVRASNPEGFSLGDAAAAATTFIDPARLQAPAACTLGVDRVSPSWKAPCSGGSTGRPKVILSGDRPLWVESSQLPLGIRAGDTLVMPAPLHHNAPYVWSMQTLLAGGHVVVHDRFDAEATLAAVDRHRADLLYLVPTMMRRIWRLPPDVRLGWSLDTLRMVWHVAEPCPPWLKHAWIDWLGADRIWEMYGGTEAQVVTVISGSEWLDHEGSVGKPPEGSVMVLRTDGSPAEVGETGEIWMRSQRVEPTYRYIGALPRARAGRWESIGDLGRLDMDGYLYLSDRSHDLIIVGGANVYPAEVEAALLRHPAVLSAVVVPLADADRGSAVGAIVQACDPEVTAEALIAFAAEHLAPYKIPRKITLTDVALRDDAGKVRRASLRHLLESAEPVAFAEEEL